MYPGQGNNQQYLQPPGTQQPQSNNPHQPQRPPSSANPFNQNPQQHQGFLSPQPAPSFSRGMYTSHIAMNSQPQPNATGGFGLGKLSAMGREVKEEPDLRHTHNEQRPSFDPVAQRNKFNFGQQEMGGKMAASFIVAPSNNEGGFGQQFKGGTSKLDAMLAKKNQPQQTAEEKQQKRKRQIQDIKKELDFINKRMEGKNFRATDSDSTSSGESKPYFQLPTRKANNPPAPVAETAKVENSAPVQAQTQKQSFAMTGAGSPKEGGMFKKKNPFLGDEASKPVEQPQKTFMLSPKGANQFKPAPNPVEYKAAEVVGPPPSQGVKNLRRIESTEDPPRVERKFKKSDFIIGKKMGKGQFGEVMLVQHKETGFLCGLKVMSKKQIREEKYVNQVARELSIQFYLNHRNVAPLYGFFDDEENMYLLVEFCTGGQLLQLLRKKHRLEDDETSPIIREICEGLDYIHKQEIIHRDIKPQNILFNFDTVKICDFGWAVHSGSGMRKTVSGSPLYYSPEIVKETEYNEKIDIWSIGMMTYECLVGKIPFKIYSQLDLNRIVQDEVKFPEYIDVTDEAKSFILGIMQKDPDDRMTMKDIFKHQFIRKHLGERRIGPEIMEEFKRVLNG